MRVMELLSIQTLPVPHATVKKRFVYDVMQIFAGFGAACVRGQTFLSARLNYVVVSRGIWFDTGRLCGYRCNL